MSRDVDPSLLRFPDDARDVWADLLRVSYPRLRLTRAPSSPWRVHEVVETRARILDSGELELYADTIDGDPVTLRIGVREWSWR